MSDLYLGVIVVFLLSAGLFLISLRIARRVSRRGATLLVLVAVGFIVLYLKFLSDRLVLARLLPFSNLIVLANWLPPAAAVTAAFAWRATPAPAPRKAMLLGLLGVLCLYRAWGPLLGEPPPLNERWESGVCRQTGPASCAPAAGATLLRACGIENATEAELANLSLTREGGTTLHGLYRGLKLKTAGTGRDVAVFSTDVAGLRSLLADGHPALLSVRLDRRAGVDPRYEQLWGWTPGVNHTVVLFRFLPNDYVEIGDPSVGREKWSVHDLTVLWKGEGLRIVPR